MLLYLSQENSNEEVAKIPELLPAQDDDHFGRKTLVLDLDETLVHSSSQPNQNYDLTITVFIILIHRLRRAKEQSKFIF